MFELAAVFLVAFLASMSVLPSVMRKLTASGIIGKDINKPGKPEVPEMGGIVIVIGFVAGVLFAIAINTFFYNSDLFSSDSILAALATVLIMALIGIFDDLFDMRQWVKALLPLAAAIPLMALQVGVTTMHIPFIGTVDFGIFYALLLVPLGVAVTSNLTNMLAGFNGCEAGMGIVMMAALSTIALTNGRIEMAVLSLSLLGALLAFIRFNWYPAKLFIGDIGTLSIGAVLASAVIVGNLESAGAILVIPFVIDFFIKLPNRFPKTFGEFRNGKLYAPGGKAMGLGQLIMKLNGGISERNLTITLILTEAFFAMIAILLYARF